MGGEEVILHLESGDYFSLNPVGSKIWHYCSQKRSLEEMIRHIASEYNLAEKKVEKDVTSYVQKLVKEQLLELSR